MSFAYVEYTIETHPFEWKVKRREEDFIKFRAYLTKMMPQYVIPPLILPKSPYDESSLNQK